MVSSDERREVAARQRKAADSDEWDVTPLYALANRVDAEMIELPKDRDGKMSELFDQHEWSE